MPKRDYANRAKTKKQSNKLLILIIIILLLLLSGLGLWALQEKAPPLPPNLPVKKIETQKSELPSRPEEIYSYIRDLETREVSVNENSKFARLSKEQEQEILRKQAEEKKRLASPTTETAQITTTPASPTENGAQASQTKQNATEEKPQKEPKKAPEVAKKAGESVKVAGKYGLQCGAFKNKAQAENMQARLAMAGYNARVSTNAGWNRVFVGPLGDRSAASNAQSNARSVAECLVVAM